MKYVPATLALKATPTPQYELLAADAITPAHLGGGGGEEKGVEGRGPRDLQIPWNT